MSEDKSNGKNTSWTHALPEDLRELPSLTKFKDETEMVSMPINVARSYVNADQLIGRDKIPMPRTEEEWGTTYDRLGRPQSKDEYEITYDTEGMNAAEQEQLKSQAAWFKEKAYALGLSNTQAKSFFTEIIKADKDNAAANEDVVKANKLETEIQLRTEFGSAYDGSLVLAKRAVAELGGEELQGIIDNSGLKDNVTVQRTLIKLGRMMAEDMGLDKATGNSLVSPAARKDMIAEVQASEAYINGKHPEHNAAVNKVAHLMRQLYGTQVIPPGTR